MDRFPVFLSADSGRLPGWPIPTFTYCDSASRGLAHYITHLRHYEHFLRWLPGFQFVYAAPSPAKFQRAEQFFRSLFEENCPATVRSLTRYFRIRRLWDEKKYGLLTRADRDVLRYGDRRYRDEFWESAYRKWTAGGSEELALEAFLSAHPRDRKWTFRTHLLPRDYDIFGSGAARTMDRRASERRSESCSASCSDEDKAKHL